MYEINGALVNTSWDRSTRHRAHPKRNALGGKGFGGYIFVAHGGKIFAMSLTSSFPVRFLFRAMENPPTSAAELDCDPDFPQLDQSPLDQQWSLPGLYHSLHYHLCRPDDRRPGRKGGVSILLLASYRSKAKASCRRLSGGFRGVADFVHGKMDRMHVWSIASSSTFDAFPRTQAFVFAGAFLHSGQPGFQLLLVRSSFFVWQVFVWFVMTVFFIFVFSLCLFCLPRNAFTIVLYFLAILANHINISSSASNGMKVLSLCRQSGWHIRTRSRSWPFWNFWQDIGLHDDRSAEASDFFRRQSIMMKDPALATQCETPCVTRLSFQVICNYFRSIWYDLRNSQRPHFHTKFFSTRFASLSIDSSSFFLFLVNLGVRN